MMEIYLIGFVVFVILMIIVILSSVKAKNKAAKKAQKVESEKQQFGGVRYNLGVVNYSLSTEKELLAEEKHHPDKIRYNSGAINFGINKVSSGSNEGLHIQLPDRTEQIERIIKKYDAYFSASEFVSFAKKVFTDIQMAWCKRDMSPVRSFLHEDLYDVTEEQLQSKTSQGVAYHYESMIINKAYLTSYARGSQFEYLTIFLNAEMVECLEDEKTGAVLHGDKTTAWDLSYKLKFVRKAGILLKGNDWVLLDFATI